VSGVIEINDRTERQAMDLPEGFVRARCDDDGRAACELLSSGMEVEGLRANLAALCESAGELLERRIAAGSLLAILGDPRIDPLRPSLIEIEGGQVLIGTPSEQVAELVTQFRHLGLKREWFDKECPRHGVTLAPYRIAKYPVTNFEYRAFLEARTDVRPPSTWKLGFYPSALANHPVYGITPSDAEAYCSWLSKETNRVFRLPTEAEWEFAAAGPSGQQFPWGDSFDVSRANTIEAGIHSTTPVGTFPDGSSPFGVMDLAGNVEEFVSDDFALYPEGKAVDDDLKSTQGAYRVARGGSFTRHHDLARCQRRHGWYPKEIYVMGFRIAETVPLPRSTGLVAADLLSHVMNDARSADELQMAPRHPCPNWCF
jgi:formylglycine-generating enzyme required for sulfatase activity